MSEPMPSSRQERQPITEETVSFADAAVELYMAGTQLMIVDAARDLGENAVASDYRLSSRIGCFVIAPDQYDIELESGFKALRDGEQITLGRSHTYGDRFEFDENVSRNHITLTRDGDTVIIRDLDSTNGTFLSTPAVAEDTTPHLETLDRTPTLQATSVQEREVTGKAAAFTVAGESIPADYRERGPNEDTFFTDSEHRTLAVFDGMGGHAGSDKASRLAAASVKASLEVVPLVLPRALAELAVQEALEKAHETIVDGTTDDAPDIGTTGIVAKVFETESGEAFATVGSAGDSRAYLLRNGRIEHVTLDHVFVGGSTAQRRSMQDTLSGFTDLAELTPEQRQRFSMRNRISSYLGGAANRPTISVNNLAMHPGDQLLLTSDGIHDNLTDPEIEEVIAGADTNVAVHDLIVAARQRSRDAAHDRAKDDDMTAAMLRYER